MFCPMKLTENFTLEELTVSKTAERKGLDNTPGEKELNNLKKLAENILQPLRNVLGEPIIVTSGYRSSAVNKAVGGVSTSEHCLGAAADIKLPSGNNAKIFDTAKKMMNEGKLNFGQLIWEHGTDKQPNWIHISIPGKHKNQILRIK